MENQELDLNLEPHSSEGDSALIHQEQCSGFFSTPSRQGVVDQIVHFMQFSEGLPVLVGDAGVGKTRLLGELSLRLSHLEVCGCCEFTGEAALVDDLVIVSGALGLQCAEQDSPGEILAALRHFCHQLTSEQKRGVLMLDNAHLLDDATLGALTSLLQGIQVGGYGISLLLSGRPGLVERLDEMAILDVPIYDFEMPQLSCAELETFIAAQGFVVSNAGEPEAIRHVWAKSMGNPGLALTLLNSGFSAKVAVEAHGKASESRNTVFTFAAGMPIVHLMAMSVLVGVLIWAIQSRDTDDDVEAVTSTEVLAPQEAPPLSVSSVEALGDDVAGNMLTTRPPIDITAVPARPDVHNLQVGAEGEALEATFVLEEAVDTSVDVVELELERAPEPVEIVAAPSVVEHTKTSQMLYQHDEAFLMSQPNSDYALQVLAASKHYSLQSYMERQENRANLYLYQSYREGKRLYVVLAGVYTSRQAALRAREHLPEEQRNAGPWPRSLKDIKQEISANSRN
ncbi:SPOR domain-containing protein [Teredinibacter purpureus]|uniref:SPOR domain-containing protein n=1 Tax=Teredinibacter purpureus TaxID=2731756 RepID=UPI0005F77281|nr:AAA family ATPase [Teredinibacter purpureus]